MPYKEEETFTEWKLDDPITAPYGKVPKLTEKPPEEKKEEKEKTDIETLVEEGEPDGT